MSWDGSTYDVRGFSSARSLMSVVGGGECQISIVRRCLLRSLPMRLDSVFHLITGGSPWVLAFLSCELTEMRQLLLGMFWKYLYHTWATVQVSSWNASQQSFPLTSVLRECMEECEHRNGSRAAGSTERLPGFPMVLTICCYCCFIT